MKIITKDIYLDEPIACNIFIPYVRKISINELKTALKDVLSLLETMNDNEWKVLEAHADNISDENKGGYSILLTRI